LTSFLIRRSQLTLPARPNLPAAAGRSSEAPSSSSHVMPRQRLFIIFGLSKNVMSQPTNCCCWQSVKERGGGGGGPTKDEERCAADGWKKKKKERGIRIFCCMHADN
jgi:hypothetical protein